MLPARIDVREILHHPLFRGVAADTIGALGDRLVVEEHAKGVVLFRRGDPGDALYVVLSGLVLLEQEIDGRRQIVALCGPSEWFGELGMLADAPRTADATVQMDTRVLRIDRAGWEVLASVAPELFARLCTRLVRQLRATTEPPRRTRRAVVACVGDDGARSLHALARSLERQFPMRPVYLLPRAGATRETLASIAELDAIILLDGADAELADRTVAYESPTSWRLTPGAGGRSTLSVRGRTPADALDRVARHVAGGTVGLALGAGGAYGYAHVGLLRALEEGGVPVDMVAGTSMGAIVGALYAAGMSADAMAEFAAQAASRYARIVMRDLDLRGPALLRGTEVARILGEIPTLATATFTSLELPFVAVAMDLDSGDEVVIDEGPVLNEIRPSFAMPGIFPPYRRGDRLLIDGAMASPVPVDHVRALGADVVIAAQPIPSLAPAQRSQSLLQRVANLVPGIQLGDKLQGLEITMRSFQALWHRHSGVAASEADVVVAPDLRAFSFLQFGSAAAIIEAGHRHASGVVGDLRSLLRERVGLRLPR